MYLLRASRNIDILMKKLGIPNLFVNEKLKLEKEGDAYVQEWITKSYYADSSRINFIGNHWEWVPSS